MLGTLLLCTVVSTIAPQQEGAEFNSITRPLSFCLEFACSPCVCMGSLRVLPHSEDMQLAGLG